MTLPFYADKDFTLYEGDSLEILSTLPNNSIDSICTDPPYGLEFMGKEWDGANGFRRSLDVEYHSDGAGKKNKPGIGARPTEWVENQGWNAFRCKNCGHLGHGGSPCRCDNPEFVRSDNRWHVYQEWCEAWAKECLRVLKPGGHLLSFAGTRTSHRLTCAIEDAGFEIRDSIAWIQATGFPKSVDVAKAIDKASRGVPQGTSDPTSPNHGKYRTTTTEGKRWDGDSGQSYGAGGSRFLADTASGKNPPPNTVTLVDMSQTNTLDATATEWQGFGTALKPAHEPIIVARKPLIGTVAKNVLTYGTGALNIDATRVGTTDTLGGGANKGMTAHTRDAGWARPWMVGDDTREAAAAQSRANTSHAEALGRWPSNVILDTTSAAVMDAETGVLSSGKMRAGTRPKGERNTYGQDAKSGYATAHDTPADSGGPSRFFLVVEDELPAFKYQAKAPQRERPKVDGVSHPTTKPVALMRWLVKLVTPPGGVVLDPFVGSGTTMQAARAEGFRSIGIEREPKYIPLIMARLDVESDHLDDTA